MGIYRSTSLPTGTPKIYRSTSLPNDTPKRGRLASSLHTCAYTPKMVPHRLASLTATRPHRYRHPDTPTMALRRKLKSKLNQKNPRKSFQMTSQIPLNLNLRQLSPKTPMPIVRSTKINANELDSQERTSVLSRVTFCLIIVFSAIFPHLNCLVARVAMVVCTDAILIAIYSGRASLGTQLSPLLYLVASKSVPILGQLGITATWDAAVCCNAIALPLAGCSLLVLSVSPRCRSALDLLALTINAGPLIKLGFFLV